MLLVFCILNGRRTFEQPDYEIRNNNELLALLRRYSPRGGMSVNKLQESWPNAKQAIGELESDGKVLVWRSAGTAEREGQMKFAFWDELGRQPGVDPGTSYPCIWSTCRKFTDTEGVAQSFILCGMD